MKKQIIPPKILNKMSSYSPFYQSVWKACFEIPRGQVRSYNYIAKKIGKPKAARAVANALKMNPFAPVIPCHRVIRANGELGGYSAPGGTKKKLSLLKHEGWM